MIRFVSEAGANITHNDLKKGDLIFISSNSGAHQYLIFGSYDDLRDTLYCYSLNGERDYSPGFTNLSDNKDLNFIKRLASDSSQLILDLLRSMLAKNKNLGDRLERIEAKMLNLLK